MKKDPFFYSVKCSLVKSYPVGSRFIVTNCFGSSNFITALSTEEAFNRIAINDYSISSTESVKYGFRIKSLNNKQ